MIDSRVLGALAIALAGAAFGFATGRISAWLVPPSGLAPVSSTTRPSAPLQPTTAEKQADRATKPIESTSSITGMAPDRPKAAGSSGPQRAADVPAAPEEAATTASARLAPQVTSRSLSPAEPSGDAGRQGARVINAGSADRPEPQEQPAAEETRILAASPDGQELCRRKFRSFDPADGTYKPFGQETRVPCPYLAR